MKVSSYFTLEGLGMIGLPLRFTFQCFTEVWPGSFLDGLYRLEQKCNRSLSLNVGRVCFVKKEEGGGGYHTQHN